MQLTKHFSLEELTHSDYAIKHQLGNIPSESSISNLKRLCELLEKIRQLLGDKPIKIYSGYRSYSVNLGVGGASTSQHRTGCASDWVHSELSIKDCMARIVDSDIEYDQIILEPSWIHVSVPNHDFINPRKEALIKTNDGYISYTS